ncbi:MAG TPA: DNA repair protein RecN [Dongiaceae bacterium]|jgi:DNA repair protein RecN (Recombination protein N)|nr:DNA repair protein RecN [Dongiaceae bacterium]
MLTALAIRNVVLIEQLILTFESGLTVLTGETGAGKSILLDALGLALGARSESGLVRNGASLAVVTAEFAMEENHPALALLSEQGLQGDRNLILRRQVGNDGRSRAFVNDQPVSVALLRQLGDLLVEIEGQFEAHGLLDVSTHRGHLDRFAALQVQVGKTRAAFATWHKAKQEHDDAAALTEKARGEEDYLRHSVAELDLAAPQPGEEVELAAERARLSNREQAMEALNGALADLAGDRGTERTLAAALRRLQRIADKLGSEGEAAVAALDRASIELTEGVAALGRLIASFDADPKRLEKLEERLYLLRDLARKHRITPDGLSEFHEGLRKQLASLENQGGSLTQLRQAEEKAREAYMAAAESLSKGRHRAIKFLEAAVRDELPPLKLERARFTVQLDKLDEAHWGENGWDQVSFVVTTNPGAAPGPIEQVASGGELARFMLALTVVLAGGQAAETLIFDEVDSGISGATATAVGERLKRLSESFQLLVITHSPQVAALADQHWCVAKETFRSNAYTTVSALDKKQRREEIARLLAGATITDEARAAADKLLAEAR